MNWVDAVVLGVVAFSALLGFLRGMVREVLGLGAWIVAAFAAVYFFPDLQGFVRRSITNPDIADPVAFGAIFLGFLIAASIFARVVGAAVRNSVLGGLDRTLGLFYGVARGGVIAIAAYILGGLYEPADQWPDQVLEARSLPSIYLGAEWVEQRLPENYRPTLTTPPAGRRASGADSLTATLAGSSTATLQWRL